MGASFSGDQYRSKFGSCELELSFLDIGSLQMFVVHENQRFGRSNKFAWKLVLRQIGIYSLHWNDRVFGSFYLGSGERVGRGAGWVKGRWGGVLLLTLMRDGKPGWGSNTCSWRRPARRYFQRTDYKIEWVLFAVFRDDYLRLFRATSSRSHSRIRKLKAVRSRTPPQEVLRIRSRCGAMRCADGSLLHAAQEQLSGRKLTCLNSRRVTRCRWNQEPVRTFARFERRSLNISPLWT